MTAQLQADVVGTVRVRPYRPDDRDAVMELAGRLVIGLAPWREPDAMRRVTREDVAALLARDDGDAAVFVAVGDDDTPSGFVTVNRQVDFTGTVQAYVGELAVAAHNERRGVGRALMSAAEHWAREKGFGLLVLDTGVANAAARRFYAQLGYAEESVRLAKRL